MIKVKHRKLLLLPGDGIGPEVVGEVKKIIQWFNKNKSLDFKIEEGLIDMDDSKISWFDFVYFQISNSLIYIDNNNLILDFFNRKL